MLTYRGLRKTSSAAAISRRLSRCYVLTPESEIIQVRSVTDAGIIGYKLPFAYMALSSILGDEVLLKIQCEDFEIHPPAMGWWRDSNGGAFCVVQRKGKHYRWGICARYEVLRALDDSVYQEPLNKLTGNHIRLMMNVRASTFYTHQSTSAQYMLGTRLRTANLCPTQMFDNTDLCESWWSKCE